MTPSASVIAARYRILRELGRGGMGVVYLVEHLGTGDHLALKVLLQHTGASPEMVERFKREARAPARIKSEHVVKVTDADVAPELGGAPFLVMELLDGMDLEKVVETRGGMSPDELMPLLRQAATALDKAHAIGITHRDLKPENLYLHRRESGPPILKILDFGISKMNGVNDIAGAGLTKSGTMMGTPLYMSPEQALGRIQQIGPPTDIWAMGLIVYRLFTGKLYWQAETIAELMVKIISEPMAPPSSRASFPPAFDGWFARSTDRNPLGRFGSVGEQIEALAEVVASVSGRTPVANTVQSFAPAHQASLPIPVGILTTGSGSSIARSNEPVLRERSRPSSVRVAIAIVAATVGIGAGGIAVWEMLTSHGAAPTNSEAKSAAATTEKPSGQPVPAKSVQVEPPSEAVASAPSASASAALPVVSGQPKAVPPKLAVTQLPKPSAGKPTSVLVAPSGLPSASAEPKASDSKKKYDPSAP